jgi:hypothetical protein
VKIAARVTCRERIINITPQPLLKRGYECDRVSIARITEANFDQVNGNIVANKLNVVELHDQGSQIGQ